MDSASPRPLGKNQNGHAERSRNSYTVSLNTYSRLTGLFRFVAHSFPARACLVKNQIVFEDSSLCIHHALVLANRFIVCMERQKYLQQIRRSVSKFKNDLDRYLPHFDGGEIVQFATYRLAESLPRAILDRIKFRRDTGQISDLDYPS